MTIRFNDAFIVRFCGFGFKEMFACQYNELFKNDWYILIRFFGFGVNIYRMPKEKLDLIS